MTLLNPDLSTYNHGARCPYPCAGLPPSSARTGAHGDGPHEPDFVALQQALRASGGLVRGEDLAMCLGHGQPGGHARLARLMVAGQVFSVGWLDTYWLPMFQFDPADLGLRGESSAVLRELVDVLDGWSLALWFVQPSSCLAGRSPLSQLRRDLPAVLQAARLQRYVVKG